MMQKMPHSLADVASKRAKVYEEGNYSPVSNSE